MNNLEVIRVITEKELKQFIDFPFLLYQNNPFWCPPLKMDEKVTLNRKKNPAFGYCEAEYWMALRNGHPVGRIAGIINRRESEQWGKKRIRFGWLDFVDDTEVTKALFDTLTAWGLKNGMEEMHGPLGFNDMDPQGMLVEGFEEPSAYSALYNYPYYITHMQNLGFRKSTDWIQYELQVPAEVPDKIERISQLILEKYDLHLLKPGKRKELKQYAPKLFRLYNKAFLEIYGFTPLTEAQIAYYTEKYLGLIRPEFTSLVIDRKDDVVGFGITIPDLSPAFRKANGSLFPFGIFHLMKAMRRNEIIHMYLIGLNPLYQGKGVLALIYHELTKAYIRHGIRIARTHPQLEDNFRAISIWKNYTGRVNIRRRCWIREL